MIITQGEPNTLLIVSQVGLWILVMLLLVTVFALARQIALLHRRIPAAGARMTDAGPAIGKKAPEFYGVDLFGKPISLGLPNKKKTLLIFVSPSCPACDDAMAALRSIQRAERRHLEIVLAALKGSAEENQKFANSHPIKEGRYLLSRELGERYQVTSAPYGVLIDTDGTVRSKGIVNHLEHLESLLNAHELGQPTMEQFFISHHATEPGTVGAIEIRASQQMASGQGAPINGGQRNGS